MCEIDVAGARLVSGPNKPLGILRGISLDHLGRKFWILSQRRKLVRRTRQIRTVFGQHVEPCPAQKLSGSQRARETVRGIRPATTLGTHDLTGERAAGSRCTRPIEGLLPLKLADSPYQTSCGGASAGVSLWGKRIVIAKTQIHLHVGI